MMTMEKANCSIYNPCGKYGYCTNDELNRSSCSCLFWWSGELCEKFSNSGVQVIILACLLTIIIGLYHGLIMYYSRVHQKYERVNNHHFKLSVKIRFSVNYSTYLTVLLILFITGTMLLIKWAVIQPIHDAMVQQYRSNQVISIGSHMICRKITHQNMDLIILAMACFSTILIALPYRRCPHLKQRCGASFGSLVPVDFFADRNRKLIAAVFTLCADQLLEVLRGSFFGSSSSDPGVVVSYLQEILRVLMMGLRYYPVLVAIHIDSLCSLLLSLLIILFELPVYIITRVLCPTNYQTTLQSSNPSYRYLFLEYFGTGSFLVVMELLIDIPRFLCLSYIIVNLTKKIYQKLRNRSKICPNMELPHLTPSEKILLQVINHESAEKQYIRNLLKSNRQNDHSLNRSFYGWRNDFRYSSRVFSVYASICLFLYIIVIETSTDMPIILNYCQQGLELWINLKNRNNITLPKNFFLRSFFIALALGTTLVIIQLFLLLISIRRNLLQAYRGDYSEIPPRNRSTYVSDAIENFHFSGYLIAFVLWSFVLSIVCVFVISLFIDAMITFYGIRFIESVLTYCIPLLLLVYFKDYLNKILARFIFLQETGDVLAIKNRPILMIFLYFNFFLDALLGIISSILRLVKSVVAGIVYMGRLDYSPLGRKLEKHDDGFSAYCGFIHTECTHRHPILLVFAAYLLEQQKRKHILKPITDQKLTNRTIQKWHRLVLLVKNPLLVISIKRKN